MNPTRLLIGALLALSIACTPAPDTGIDAANETGTTPAPISTGPDPHSYANHDQVVVEHLTLDLDVDLRRRVLDGFVILDLERVEGASAERVVLDTRQL